MDVQIAVMVAAEAFPAYTDQPMSVRSAARGCQARRTPDSRVLMDCSPVVIMCARSRR